MKLFILEGGDYEIIIRAKDFQRAKELFIERTCETWINPTITQLPEQGSEEVIMVDYSGY